MAAPEPSRPSQRHYGICVSEIFADYKHGGGEAVKDDYHGRKVVPDQLIWLVRKGDLVPPDEPLMRKFGINCKFSYQQISSNERVRLMFVSTALDEAPSTLREMPKGKPTFAQTTMMMFSWASEPVADQPDSVVMLLDLYLGHIPKAALKTERRKDFFRSPYYQVDMDAVVEIDTTKYAAVKTGEKVGRVMVKLVCAGQILIQKSSSLED
jgi:hypothetical protein